jgi:magnesium chelatase subunit D
MSVTDATADAPWDDAARAAALFAVDPTGLGGVALRAPAGPVRDRWLLLLRELLPPDAPVRRLPLGVGDERLLGGLDLAATLASGRPVASRGLLADADGGIVLLAMAERVPPLAVARLTAALDAGEVLVERDGFALRLSARFGVVALDEGLSDDERPPAALLDRLAFHVDLGTVAARNARSAPFDTEDLTAARAALASVRVGDDVVEALCAAALALGIASIRAPILALRAARAAAALAGRREVTHADAALAGRLVLAPRATAVPAAEPAGDKADEAPPAEHDGAEASRDRDGETAPVEGGALDDVVLAAAQAAIPAGLLAQLRLAGGSAAPRAPGRAGGVQRPAPRGRPAGVRRGEGRAGARLSVIDTLRAAAPWQALRRRARSGEGAPRVEVRREDFRVRRFKERARTTTIFVVDASGSAAFYRLAEAKGAVELLLAEAYIRRDRVALLAFRGRGADLLLAPTRSLVRAKRGLAGLPGGGGTPLAAGIDAAASLADGLRRRGETPALVFLTDGRANVARDGIASRVRAETEALGAARALGAAGLTAILVDTAPHAQASARRLADAMGAQYLPLPYADAGSLSRAVRAATSPRPPA